MSTNRFRVGDTVRIRNRDRHYNGQVGKVVAINGEYHYIEIKRAGFKPISIEAYRTELSKEGVFEEDLFKI